MRLVGCEDFIEGPSTVGIEIVLHQTDALDMWIPRLNQVSHKESVFFFGATPEDTHHAPATERFDGHHHTTGAVASIFIVLFQWRPWTHGERDHHIADELTWAFIKANLRKVRIIGLFIEIEEIFHTGQELTIYLRKAPLMFLPRLEVVFFN